MAGRCCRAWQKRHSRSRAVSSCHDPVSRAAFGSGAAGTRVSSLGCRISRSSPRHGAADGLHSTHLSYNLSAKSGVLSLCSHSSHLPSSVLLTTWGTPRTSPFHPPADQTLIQYLGVTTLLGILAAFQNTNTEFCQWVERFETPSSANEPNFHKTPHSLSPTSVMRLLIVSTDIFSTTALPRLPCRIAEHAAFQ